MKDKTEHLHDLLDMEMHQEILINDYCNVIRVPGGWIYKVYTYEYKRSLLSTCFVPEPIYNNPDLKSSSVDYKVERIDKTSNEAIELMKQDYYNWNQTDAPPIDRDFIGVVKGKECEIYWSPEDSAFFRQPRNMMIIN